MENVERKEEGDENKGKSSVGMREKKRGQKDEGKGREGRDQMKMKGRET